MSFVRDPFFLSAFLILLIFLESRGKSPLAFSLFFVVGLVTFFVPTNKEASDPYLLPVFLFSGLICLLLLHAHRRKLDQKKWGALLSQDEEKKEIKNIKGEIALYEQREADLSHRTEQRRFLSRAARELGALLDPAQIQAKLVQIAQLIFPEQNVFLSTGQNRDPIDSYVFQKRQPLLVPGEQIKGPPLMAVPISVQKSVAGVLRVGGESLAGPAANRAYSRDDLRLLDSLANLASLAMDNCQLFQQVQQSALRDNLTGLLTHRAFQDELEAALLEASRYNQPLSLILADIDHFKSVNDNYGHPAGDAVLQGFAHIMDRNARPVDIIARYGGEEFAIILLQTPHKTAWEMAERIRQDLSEQAFDTESGVLSITGSFGVSTFPEDATSGQQLMRQADQRLYKAKTGGRNRVVGRT